MKENLKPTKKQLKGISNRIKYFGRLSYLEEQLRVTLTDEWVVKREGIRIIITLKENKI